jgi:hypothetical protein
VTLWHTVIYHSGGAQGVAAHETTHVPRAPAVGCANCCHHQPVRVCVCLFVCLFVCVCADCIYIYKYIYIYIYIYMHTYLHVTKCLRRIVTGKGESQSKVAALSTMTAGAMVKKHDDALLIKHQNESNDFQILTRFSLHRWSPLPTSPFLFHVLHSYFLFHMHVIGGRLCRPLLLGSGLLLHAACEPVHGCVHDVDEQDRQRRGYVCVCVCVCGACVVCVC